MNISNEILEILMGKQIDSEITPAEKCMLDQHLETDSQARILMDELTAVNDLASAAVESDLAAVKSAEDIFEAAWQKTSGGSYYYTRWIKRNLRFAYGLAAGLMIGILMQLNHAALDNNQPGPGLAGNTETASVISNPIDPGFKRPERNVDLYMFTDTDGRRWMMEAYRENNNIQPAMYYKGF